MADEIDLDQLFVKFGMPGEAPDDDWLEMFFEAMRETGECVARHEWCGAHVICPLPSGPGTIILEPWREIWNGTQASA